MCTVQRTLIIEGAPKIQNEDHKVDALVVTNSLVQTVEENMELVQQRSVQRKPALCAYDPLSPQGGA